ncbi:MAG: TetR/AcrR family transcriptional regulator [Treponema sp.]|nr:TetR/AcrR family transcriptional regulator [Treponema sp.]
MDKEQEKTSTRQRILEQAIDLFAMKGYTETTIRELATAVGLKEASIYNHFPSKNAILEYIIEEYSQFSSAAFNEERLLALKGNPSADDLLSCMQLAFTEGREEYFLKELYVILQEQHRNPLVGKFVSEHYIMANEEVVKRIINALKEFGVLRPDTDPDFWAKMYSCLIYTFASRLMLGIGDSSPDFSGMGMVDMLRNMYDMMLKTCAAK